MCSDVYPSFIKDDNSWQCRRDLQTKLKQRNRKQDHVIDCKEDLLDLSNWLFMGLKLTHIFYRYLPIFYASIIVSLNYIKAKIE